MPFGPETLLALIAVAIIVLILFESMYGIGPTQVGLVRKRFGAKLPGDNPLAFHGEAGFQAELIMPGLRFKLCLVYAVTKHPWVQVPAGQIGAVIAQVGQPLPIGAKSAVYRPEFGNFTRPENICREGWPEGCVEAGAISWHTRAHPSGRLPGDH
jgi:hypothetical protein